MGGDDDGYLLNFSFREEGFGGDKESNVALVADNESSLPFSSDNASNTNDRKTRKRKEGNQEDHDADESVLSSPAKKKKKKSNSSILLETSRNLLELSRDEQAMFLSTALTHYTQMSSDDHENDDKEIMPSTSRLSRCLIQPTLKKEKGQDQKQDQSVESMSFLDRLLTVTTKKRLKRHVSSRRSEMANNSPFILIVCQSARRAVALLKECAPLGVKAAKLFPKQASVSKQAQELRSYNKNFGIAVGTPNRLLSLLSSSKEGFCSLDLSSTQLVVLDAAPCLPKNYTVCTLPDTAQDCMTLVQDHVWPELRKRKDIKLAFL